MTPALPGRLYPPVLYLMLATLAGDIILTAGFMLLRVPPGGPGVPVNQIALALGLAILVLSGRSLGAVTGTASFVPLYGLWVLAAGHLILDVPRHGVWAIRDAANILESGFFVIGFALATDTRFRPALTRWLDAVFICVAFYALLYPFQGQLARFSPMISSMSGYEAPLFFNFVNTSSVALTAVCHILLRKSWPPLVRAGLAGLVVMWLIVFVQARITYLQLVFLVALLALFARRELGEFAVVALLAAVFAGLFLLSGIRLPGRLGQTFSLDFLLSHVQAIWGGGGEATRDAAEGVGLRMRWWAEIQGNLARSPLHWFLGLGYGQPLTSFRGLSDDVVREPHNSYVSIYGRLGVIGISLFLGFLAATAATAARLIGLARRSGDRELGAAALTMTCFLGVHVIYAVGEGGMEVSFIAAPFYFFAGAIGAMARRAVAETAP